MLIGISGVYLLLDSLLLILKCLQGLIMILRYIVRVAHQFAALLMGLVMMNNVLLMQVLAGFILRYTVTQVLIIAALINIFLKEHFRRNQVMISM